MRRILALAAVTAMVLLLSASSCDRKGLGDAPVGRRDEAPRRVIIMPDKFPNLAVYCDGATAIYVNTRSAGNMAQIANSKFCGGER